MQATETTRDRGTAYTFAEIERALNGDQYDWLVMGDRRATPREPVDVVALLWAFLPEWQETAKEKSERNALDVTRQ